MIQLSRKSCGTRRKSNIQFEYWSPSHGSLWNSSTKLHDCTSACGIGRSRKNVHLKGNHIGITEAPDDMFGKVMSISDETMLLWYPQLLGQDAPSDDPLGSKKDLARKIVERFHDAAAAKDTLEWWNAGRPARNMDVITLDVGPLRSLVVGAGFAKSNGEARRKISQGGVSLNGERISDPNNEIAPGEYLLQVGKKSSIKILVK